MVPNLNFALTATYLDTLQDVKFPIESGGHWEWAQSVTTSVGNVGTHVFGAKFEKKAQFVGGVILVLLGLKILLEHLKVL